MDCRYRDICVWGCKGVGEKIQDVILEGVKRWFIAKDIQICIYTNFYFMRRELSKTEFTIGGLND